MTREAGSKRCIVPGLKRQEGATSQEMQAASRSLESQGNRFSSSISRKEYSPASTFILVH